jgi:general secretion pathway protein F
MSAWAYAAINERGRRIRGHIDAETARQARSRLRDQGLTPLEIKPLKSGRPEHSNSLKATERVMIAQQLGALLASDIPVDDALTLLQEQNTNPRVHRIISGLKASITAGQSLAEAMAGFPRAFSKANRDSIAAGEQAGRLGEVLSSIAEHEQANLTLRRKTTIAAIYPLALLLVALGITAGLSALVVPQVVAVYERTDAALPWVTRFVIALSHLVTEYGLMTIMVILVGILGVRVALRHERWRERFDQMLLGIPMIGPTVRSTNTLRFTRSLALLTKSGIPLVDSMEAAQASINNRIIQQKLRSAIAEIKSGAAVDRSIERTGCFPPIASYLLRNATATGRIDEMLAKISDHEETALKQRIAIFTGLFEPVLVVVMGGLVLLIVLAIMLPLLEINTLLG